MTGRFFFENLMGKYCSYCEYVSEKVSQYQTIRKIKYFFFPLCSKIYESLIRSEFETV